MMDEERFWTIVEQTKAAAGNDGDAQAAELQKALEQLSAEDIVAFDATWTTQINRAYTWDLWAGAYIINGGCSDDGFEYFRRWLVGQGRQVFEAALKDPESLLDVAEANVENEDLGYAALDAYQKVTGKEFSYDQRPAGPDDPLGEEWDEDTVSTKYPKLAAKFE